jgi:hypothetical protein
VTRARTARGSPNRPRPSRRVLSARCAGRRGSARPADRRPFVATATRTAPRSSDAWDRVSGTGRATERGNGCARQNPSRCARAWSSARAWRHVSLIDGSRHPAGVFERAPTARSTAYLTTRARRWFSRGSPRRSPVAEQRNAGRSVRAALPSGPSPTSSTLLRASMMPRRTRSSPSTSRPTMPS